MINYFRTIKSSNRRPCNSLESNQITKNSRSEIHRSNRPFTNNILSTFVLSYFENAE